MFETLRTIAVDFWVVLAEMSPYLLFGFLAAGALSVLVSPQAVERHLGGRGIWPVVKAAAFGVPLPLCSCGVIPVSASLRRHGASRGATTSFLLSTPQTGVDSILVTYGLLGGVLAIFRPLAALLSGILGGGVVAATDDREPASTAPRDCRDACCAENGHGKIHRMLQYGLVTLPRDIAKPLLVGLAVAALISALRPEDFFAPYLGGGLLAIVVMMVIGIPVYVCATASIPVAYALIASGGVSPGAAFAFLVTGPATNAATLAVVWRVLGRRTALIYLATIVLCAVVGGTVLDQLVTRADIRAEHGTHWMPPDFVKWISAPVLLGVLLTAICRKAPAARDGHRHEADATGDGLPRQVTRLGIRGMTCSHCAENIRRALAECPGVESVAVDLGANCATVSGAHYDPDALREAVERVGYRVRQGEQEKTPADGETP